MFCMQESAKATLNMKDCQMTDRTTQTEHMGPEVRHKENTGSFFSLGRKHKSAPHTSTFWKNAWINDIT